MSDPYSALASQDLTATDDPYAALIPKAKGATASSPPNDTDPYAALVPHVPASSGAFPTADNKIDPLASAEMPGTLTALVQGVVSGARGVQSTIQGGGESGPTSPAAQPFDWGSLAHPIARGLPQVAYRLGEGAPMLGGGIAGGVAGGIAAPEFEPASSLVGGAMGAGLGSLLQTLGPAYENELKQSPNDPEGAWSRAKVQAGIGAAGSAGAWAAFPLKLIEGPIKNAIFQAVSIQPGIAVGTKVAQNVAAGKPYGEGTDQAAIEGAVMTALPLAGHAATKAAVSRFNSRTTTPPTSQQINATLNGMAGPEEPPTTPPPSGPQGFPPAPKDFNAATAFPKPPEGFDYNTAFPPPATPPDYTVKPLGSDELNPPPAEPPDLNSPAAGPVNIDMGFGLTIQRRKAGEPFTLVDSEGNVLTKSDTFDDIKGKATNYLDTGSVEPQTPINPTTDLSPDVTQFLAKKAPKLTDQTILKGGDFDLGNNMVMRREDLFGDGQWSYNIYNSKGEFLFGSDNLKTARDFGRGLPSNASLPMKEEITARPGVNTARMAKLLGPKLYGTPEDLPAVTVKELFQNGFDAIKTQIEKGAIDTGHIRIATDKNARTITFFDNGSGMTPEVLGKQFLEIAGTHKESERASGGLGIAKMLTLFGNKGLRVVTMRDGKVSRMATSGEALFAALEDPSQSPKIHYSEPTAQERTLFPDGHGTAISVVVPSNFVDPETGDKRHIYFPTTADEFPVLKNSPLLNNIHVTFNDAPVANMGANFPVDDYTNMFNVKFNWGEARIYVSKAPANENYPYISNTHVLSNGLWQFSRDLKSDPGASFGPNITRQFYVDLNPKAKPEDPGYPFDLNRQRFSKTAGDDLEKIFNYISLLYKHDELRNSATNFGEMYYLDQPTGKLEKSGPVKIEPKKPADNPINLIQPGDKVSVIDGQIRVNGREVPTLDPKDIKKMSPDANELKVDQKEIDPNRVMVHDNTLVKLSDTEQKSIVTLAQEKFGQRFEQFMMDVGGSFRDLRNIVAKGPQWKGTSDEAVGVSFDKQYRGVSIRVPFSGSFINPAIPEYSDPLRAAVGVVGTMVHELAHYNVRSHDADFPAEMQRILIYLDTHPEFDFHAFKQKVVNTFAQNKDIFDYINGFYSGAFDLQSRGKRFKDTGANEARNGSPAESVGETGIDRGSGASVSEPTPTGPPRSLQSFFGQGYGRRVEESGSSGPLAEQRRNTSVLRKLDSGLTAEFPQPELGPVKDGVNVAAGGSGGVNPGVTELGIHADRMNKMYKWLWGLDRLVDRNMNFTPLLRYAERIREMRLDTSKIHDAGLRIAKQWRRLGNKAEPLAALIDDVTNMSYRTPAEASKGVRRMPTQVEFDALIKKHNVDADALKVFDKQRKFFSTFLDLVTQNAMDTAKRTIQDPVALAAKLDAIVAQKANLAKAPYFPFTRFGSHFLTVRDAAGNVTFFETYERKGPVSAERVQQRAKAELQRTLPQGSTIVEGVLPETAAPFVGMPPELLESISKELSLTKDQQDALDQIRYQFAPAASFVHHFQSKNYTPGYSSDFLRAFSRYAFHGARYYSRVKYAWALRDEIKAARSVGGNKAGAIANYMEDHLQNAVLDAKGDFGVFKGAIFLWVFGYSPAGAAINLSQIPMISYPFLAAKFGGFGVGDARATAALVKAMSTLSNFYKKGSYDNATEFENRALDYGIKSGRISEAMASELAGLAQGNNLLGLGRSKLAQGFQTFMEKAASMFELSEQLNRRVTYRAALDLAMAHPDSIGVKEALSKYADEYAQLQAKGFNPQEAAAIITAAHVTEQTQFVYARETRPRAFRGKLAGTLLVFKTYMLNVLQLLGANKSSVMPRFMLMMLAMAGIYGLPGAEDLNDIVQQLGKWYFGKDFNVKLALRQLILELGKGSIPPDIVLNGLAKKGFGIPAMMDMMGEHPGRGLGGAPDTPETRANYAQWALQMRAKGSIPGSYEQFRKQHSQNVPVPQVDLSKSLGMGRLLPFDLGKVLDPGSDPNTAIAGTAQQASGAVFSVGFNLYKALQDEKAPASDWKRWERTLPRAVASASRAYRAYDEGRERSRGGPAGAATITNYDVRDPEQAAEVMAMAAGFMPSRQSSQWDSITAQAEVQAKFKFEKDLLMTQMYEAQAGKNPEEIARVKKSIMDYNANLPQWAKGESITGKGLKASIESRFKDRQYREAGVPRSKNEIPVARHVQGLFPESVVDVRRLPR